MSYHRFTNLPEAFAGNLVSKLNKNVGSKDFKDLSCNCNTSSKINGNCIFDRECQKSVVIYKATCKPTGKSYIGNIQEKFKKRIKGHLNYVCNLDNLNQQSDSFARHFVTVSKPSNRST